MNFQITKMNAVDTGAYYTFANVPLSELNGFVLVPTTGSPGVQYTVGSVHVLVKGATAWSAARVTPCASNDPQGFEYAAHPDGTALTPTSTISVGLALDYTMFGFYVSVAEASVVADVHICLKP